jgi:hypothetical protein
VKLGGCGRKRVSAAATIASVMKIRRGVKMEFFIAQKYENP